MKTIFIVDDNNTNLKMAKDALDGSYRALAIQSAEKMFELIQKIKPDLILLDVEMPGMDGHTALVKLKENKEYAHIPVIFVTAYTSDALEAQALEEGAVDFITKPFSPQVLRNRVANHLRVAELTGQLDMLYQKLLAGEFKEAFALAKEYRTTGR